MKRCLKKFIVNSCAQTLSVVDFVDFNWKERVLSMLSIAIMSRKWRCVSCVSIKLLTKASCFTTITIINFSMPQNVKVVPIQFFFPLVFIHFMADLHAWEWDRFCHTYFVGNVIRYHSEIIPIWSESMAMNKRESQNFTKENILSAGRCQIAKARKRLCKFSLYSLLFVSVVEWNILSSCMNKYFTFYSTVLLLLIKMFGHCWIHL